MNIFTYFLTAPIPAYCFLYGITSIKKDVIDNLSNSVDKAFDEIQKILENDSNLGNNQIITINYL